MQRSDGSQEVGGVPAGLPNTATQSPLAQMRVVNRPAIISTPGQGGQAAIGVIPVGQQGITTTAAGFTLAPQPAIIATGVRPAVAAVAAPQAMVVSSQTVSRLLSPPSTLQASTVQLPATINVLQRQLSAPGVVGLSAVSAQDLQQVLQHVSQQSITLLTADPNTTLASNQQRPRLARPLSFPLSATPPSPTLHGQPTSSVSATGGTIHHHGQSPVRGGLPLVAASLSHSNLHQSILSMNLNQQQQLAAIQRRVVTTLATTTATVGGLHLPASAVVTSQTSRTVSEVRAGASSGLAFRTTTSQPPRKKIKVEEKPAATPEISNYRRMIVDLKHKEMLEIKANYFENLTEMFFLQSGNNLMDYHSWKKRPTPQLVDFLKSGNLDSDDEEDILQVKEINAEVKVLTNPGSNVPLATPVAISTTLPPMVSALSQQVVAPSGQTVSAGSAGGTSTPVLLQSSLPSSSTAISATSQLQLQLARGHDAKGPAVKGQLSPSKQHKSPPLSPGQRLYTRKQSLSAVYDNLSGGSQEVIVERAKQEAQVMQRVAELRKDGLWSSRRLPRVQEPPRQKAHWDYLLEEMTWLAADFVQERKWKKAASRKLARMVSNYFKEQEQKELRAEKEEGIKLKKIASHMAKMVKEFWTNIEKVVQYKQQTRLDEKKKKALDLHLNFIVDQTEKYSTWLTEGLKGGSVSGSFSTSPAHSSDGDDFEPSDNTSDDEETIEKEEKEAAVDEVETKKELEDLEMEGELPLEELLKTLPEEVLSAPAPIPPSDADEESSAEEGGEKQKESDEKKGEEEGSDKEFAGAEEEAVDEEDTIAEQEKHEKRNYKDELQDLQVEGEMSIEDLAAKYAGAYDSDFEMPQESSSEEEEEGESEIDSDDFEIETEESSEEEDREEEKEEDKENTNQAKEPGLEALVKPSGDASSISTPKKSSEDGKEKEKEPTRDDLSNIAEQAQSLQPKGYTLETTEVKTKVPFLLKHSLREYQHVGLDWLATMHEKRLNGILADEMGLGKTIQTIALLAHLACEKSIWGPHLIVVPTSVMLNWEMELKKWCPAFKILTYYGNQKERKLKRQGWTKTNAFHVCITSYKLVVQDHQAFRRKKWKYLILDEAQNIKNFKSQRWQMLLNFSSQRRLLLTGTPLQNSLMELWSLMHFLMPNVFQSHRDFKEWFSNPLTGMIEGSQEYNESLIKRLHKVLRPFLLRRLKNEVEKQMPKKFEHVVLCRLSKRQRFLYDDFMSQAKTRETLAAGHYMSVINILMQLRKVCNHPNLFDPRPILSPFRMEGLVYNTASIVTRALQYNAFEHVDMKALFPNLAEMERDLPAFVAHRVKQLRTSNNLIEEIDSQPDPHPRPPQGQLKNAALRSVSPALAQTSGRASPVSLLPQAPAASPADVAKAAQLHASTPPTAVKVAVLSQPTVQTTPGSPAVHPTSLPAAVVTPATATFTTVRTTGGQTLLLTSQARIGGTGSTLILSSVGQTIPTLTVVTAASAPTSTAVPTSATPLHTTLQAKVMPQQLHGTLQATSGSASVLTSQPFTVQIQQTEQGTRLMIPTGQLSQLPASLFQIVQTPTGQQLIATSSAAQVSSVLPLQTAVATTASSTVNGPSPSTTVAATSTLVLVTTAVSQVKAIPALTASAAAATTSLITAATTMPVASKPVMRVSPMVAAATTTAVTSTALTGSIVSTTASLLGVKQTEVKKRLPPPVKKSEMYLESLHKRRELRRREKLRRLARINSAHCSQTPVYGPDVHQALSFAGDIGRPSNRGDQWLSQGYTNCLCAHAEHNRKQPRYYWHETRHLADLIHTPDQYLEEQRDILDRFVFATPSVISHGVQMRVGHPDPSQVVRDVRLYHSVREQLHPLSTRLNTIQTKATIQFPELRLIQYDCGKLQTLDVLLRQLKTDHHRVLIFTQMTKMLDVLEAFLNYHGHRYLRLDGTTKVEQRQQLMDRFNADKRIFCFILSTRSGGIGVNLTGADTVVFYDSDWNPTMDAQAQDRCHRIGQTRDVHIYRLISEMTVEENILKKANQKRLLGDLAIEGGNFTTAFFKEQTIKDLFAQPSGLKSLADQKRQREQERMEKEEGGKTREEEQDTEKKDEMAGSKKDSNLLAAFEQALCKAEDETDAMAATLVKAEQKAELAEFDENIPWDEREAEARKEEEEMSRAELELAMLDKELTPIERYAVVLVESQMEDEVAEELKMAEEDIQNSKKDWELARLKALKEEEERRAEMEDDEMLYTYLRDDAQVFISNWDGSEMPIWAPPTPPQDDNDVYLDQTMLFLHEPSVMAESQLPPVYVRKEHKKPRVETITTRKQKQRKEEAPRVPRSLFDRPTSVLLKMRRELKMKNLKAGLINKQPFRPTPPLPAGKPVMEQSEGHPEWLIHEDWALLQAVQTLLNLPLNLTVVSPAHIPNWDMVAEVVNSCSRVYRSVKQCKARYENVIIPREEGRILYDVSPRKQKKTKGIYKTKNNRPMKTSQLYSQDGNSSISLLYSLRFDSVKGLASKRPATMRQILNNPTLKNPKHAAVLQENGINYDQPLNPMQVAAIRAERIAREKKQNQAAAQAAAEQMAAQRTQQQQQQPQQGTVQTVTGVAASAPTVAQAVTGQQLHSLVSVTTPTTIIQAGPTAKMAVGQGMTAVSIARTLPTTGSIVAVTGSLASMRQRSVAVHEITTVAGNVAVAAQAAAQAQARATLQPTASASANLTAQLANNQKIAAMAGVQQLAAKNLTQQINLLRPIVRTQSPQSATQPQQLRAQKLSFATQKQAGLLRTMTSEQIQALKVRQLQQKQVQGGQLQTQILQGQVQQVGQSGAVGATPVTLVKSVAAPSGTSAVPIPVSINVTMGQGQQKQGLIASRGATVSQLHQQQRMQLLHQQRKGLPIQQPQKVTALTGQARAGQIPLIIPQQGKITGHLLHQIVKNQQIIHTSQPAIITAVTQGQTLQPMVAKVSLTTVPHTTPIQTLPAAAGSPITVTQVAAPPTAGQTHSVATINVTGAVPVSQAVMKTATLTTVDPSQQQQQISAAPKVATISQSLVQPLQLASSPLSQQQTQSIVTQHRVLTASPASINAPTAVVVSNASLVQAQQTGTTVVQQAQPLQSQQQAVVSAQLVAASQAVSTTPGAVATLVTQTQQPQLQQQAAQQQLSAQQQQQTQKTPYAMRSRNPPKH